MALARIERFSRKYVVADDGCWQWTASKNEHGYGHFWNGSRVAPAHRWSLEFHVGPVPEGLELDHFCRNRSCVNPEHLEPVTRAENNRRAAAAQTHCINGHEFTEENTVVRRHGYRKCRTCKRAADLRWRKK